MSLVITGNPGVGKHTLAKKIAKNLKYKILDINKIALEMQFNKKNNDVIDVDVEKVANILKKRITKNSLIVGHLAPYVLSKSQVKTAIILRKSPYKLDSIYKKRNYAARKIIENIQSEILGVIAYDTIKKFGKKKTYQIDTTSKSVTNIIKKINTIFEDNFQLDNVDWLSLVFEKNDHKKFFPHFLNKVTP